MEDTAKMALESGLASITLVKACSGGYLMEDNTEKERKGHCNDPFVNPLCL